MLIIKVNKANFEAVLLCYLLTISRFNLANVYFVLAVKAKVVIPVSPILTNLSLMEA